MSTWAEAGLKPRKVSFSAGGSVVGGGSVVSGGSTHPIMINVPNELLNEIRVHNVRKTVLG